jgi:hypothetical protein
MDRRISLPVFGRAPNTYVPQFMDDVVRMLNILTTVLRNPGEGRQTTMVLTDLPTTDYGLEPGALFQVDGAVRISLQNKPYVVGLSATGGVGTVSVTV